MIISLSYGGRDGFLFITRKEGRKKRLRSLQGMSRERKKEEYEYRAADTRKKIEEVPLHLEGGVFTYGSARGKGKDASFHQHFIRGWN